MISIWPENFVLYARQPDAVWALANCLRVQVSEDDLTKVIDHHWVGVTPSLG